MGNLILDARLSRVVEKVLAGGPQASTAGVSGELSVILSHIETPAAKIDEFLRRGASPGEAVLELKRFNELGFQEITKVLNDLGTECSPLSISNSLACHITIPDLRKLEDVAKEHIKIVRLNPQDRVTTTDDSRKILRIPESLQESSLTGKGVRVAVIDSGIDVNHPSLKVAGADNVSVHDEGADRPGVHGTHVAGIIASNHPVYRGMSPDVTLINVKAMSAAGYADPSQIVKGLQKAMELKANVINLSVGWSHIPKLGHDWVCPDGDCDLCRAVDAVTRLGSVVIIAAGNERDNAAYIRKEYPDLRIDTEITCPGNARTAITVGAVAKNLSSWTRSSRGPAAYGEMKPDVVAPGVKITSTIPGFEAFGSDSGTSMAAPHVSALAALVIEGFDAKGTKWTPQLVKNVVMKATRKLDSTVSEQGQGLVDALYAVLEAKK